MSEERRYSEHEVAEILDRATAPERDVSSLAGPKGLTIEQIKEIGSEAGISPTRIAQAALVVANPPIPRKEGPQLLGAARTVERVVHLERAMSDEEWSRLVSDLRQTFDAEGQLESHGTLRSWRNGHLQVHLEPGGDGYRIRMLTKHGNSEGAIGFGILFFLLALGMVFLTTTSKVTGNEDVVFGIIAAVLGASGVGLVGAMRLALPKWSALREAQFDALAHRIPLMLDP